MKRLARVEFQGMGPYRVEIERVHSVTGGQAPEFAAARV